MSATLSTVSPILLADCPSCDGSGVDFTKLRSALKRNAAEVARCPVCAGTGKILEPVKRGRA